MRLLPPVELALNPRASPGPGALGRAALQDARMKREGGQRYTAGGRGADRIRPRGWKPSAWQHAICARV